jgi:hypothetical protein
MKETVDTGRRTPARKMTREDLANVTSGGLMLGCCTQGCCGKPPLWDLPSTGDSASF